MNRNIRNIFIGSSVVLASAAVYGAVAYSVGEKLIALALDRDMPKGLGQGIRRISGIKNFDGAYDVLTGYSETLKNCGCEDVEIRSRDGVWLRGHWYECDKPKRVIIAMHGWRSDWAHDFGAISEFWHKNGCSVLYAEQRGQNGSGGDHMGFGMLERHDCIDWIDWVRERTLGSLPIYLGGISMGATTVLMAAGLDLPEDVHGIVADCGFTSPKAIWKHVSERNLHIPYSVHSAVADSLCKRKLRMSPDECSSVEALKLCKVPIMFIHGTDDTFVPVEMTYENYRACASPKRLFVVPGANHAMSYLLDKDGYEREVLSFWKDYD